jgi:hypothetical protein
MHSGLDFGATDAPVADTAPFDHDTPLGEPTDAPPPYHSVVLQSTNSVVGKSRCNVPKLAPAAACNCTTRISLPGCCRNHQARLAGSLDLECMG